MKNQILKIMKALNVSEEQATEVLQSAIDNPGAFSARNEIINEIKHKTAPMTKVKGIQIRNTQAPRRRNDLCSCGSGKKTKKCVCYKKDKIVGLVFHREKDVNTA